MCRFALFAIVHMEYSEKRKHFNANERVSE